ANPPPSRIRSRRAINVAPIMRVAASTAAAACSAIELRFMSLLLFVPFRPLKRTVRSFARRSEPCAGEAAQVDASVFEAYVKRGRPRYRDRPLRGIQTNLQTFRSPRCAEHLAPPGPWRFARAPWRLRP